MASLLSQDFFDLPKTKRSIHELAEVEGLVLFVGSGASASQGLPVWNGLLRRLLDKAAAEHPDLAGLVTAGKPASEEFVQTLMQTTDPIILGSIVRRLYPSDEAFVDTLSHAIYSEVRRLGGPRPASNFTRAVWELIFTRRERGLSTLIVTTNYDDALETSLERDPSLRALGDSVGVLRAVPIHSKQQFLSHLEHRTEDDRSELIYHIHGYVPSDSSERIDVENIVLSARDYGQSWEEHWSFELLSEYWTAHWLFVGMSFHGPHITFFLRARDEHLGDERDATNKIAPPRGVFSLQGQPWASLSEHTKLALAHAEISRLKELGMKALPTLYFFQDAQMLREVALRASMGDTYVPYVERRAKWAVEFITERGAMEGEPEAHKLLQTVHLALLELRRSMEVLAPHDDERFKFELWCRDLVERCLFQFGSSEALSNETDRARRFPLATDLPIAAVQAFTAGAPTTSDVPLSAASRWQYYFGVPITLGDDPWFELPVDALVIASTLPEASSALRTQRVAIEARIEEWTGALAPYLDPQVALIIGDESDGDENQEECTPTDRDGKM